MESCAGERFESLGFYEGQRMGGGPYNPTRVTFAAVNQSYLTLTVQKSWWPMPLSTFNVALAASSIEALPEGSELIIDDDSAFVISGHLIRADGLRLSIAEYGVLRERVPPPLDVSTFRGLLQDLAQLDSRCSTDRPTGLPPAPWADRQT